MNRIHGGRPISDKGLDLSVNINPYGPHPALWDRLRRVRLDRYPDPHCERLRTRIARDYNRSADHIVVGNGAAEILWAAARAFLRDGKTYALLEPTFSEFDYAATQCGARRVSLRLEAPFDVPWDAWAAQLAQESTTVAYFCNPNSPSGRYEKPERIRDLAHTLPQLLIILDESFLSLSDDHEAWRERYPDNVLRLQSLTRDHGIPGLRLGFAEGAKHWVDAIARELPSWNVNALAQEAGLFLLDQTEFVAECRQRIRNDRDRLQASLQKRAWPFIPSRTCFLMMEGHEALAEKLWHEHEIHVRSCASYGFAQYWRIAVRPEAIQDRFFAALDGLKGIL